MQFRLTLLLSVTILTGCAAEELRAPDAVAADQPGDQTQAEQRGTNATNATPFVGTWRWSGSGGRIGDIDLGEENFVFRDNGTYAVVSKAGDGSSECYEGTFTWSTAAAPNQGKIVFKGSHVRDTEQGFERDVYLDGDDTLHFGEGGGTYRRTGPVLDVRCP